MDDIILSQEPLFDTGKDPIIEWWDPNDPRLPKVLDRPKNQDFKDMCTSLKSGQIYSVIVGRWVPQCDEDVPPPEFEYYYDGTYCWALADGRQRVAACREIKLHVRIEIVDTAGPSDILRLRATANFIRSANEAADVLAIRRGVYFEGKNYADVIPGMSKKEAVRLDKAYQGVPDEVLVAVAEGRCSKSTAKEIKKLKGKNRDKVLDILQETGNLKAADVKEVRAAVKTKAVGTMTWMSQPTQVRTNFDRMEMEHVGTLLQRREFDKALEFVTSILA